MLDKTESRDSMGTDNSSPSNGRGSGIGRNKFTVSRKSLSKGGGGGIGDGSGSGGRKIDDALRGGGVELIRTSSSPTMSAQLRGRFSPLPMPSRRASRSSHTSGGEGSNNGGMVTIVTKLENQVVSFGAYGDAPDVIHLKSYRKHLLKDRHHAVIKVESSTISRMDCQIRRDRFHRRVKKLPCTAGCDMVGIVIQMRRTAEGYVKVGDRVCAIGIDLGGNARYVVVEINKLIKVPLDLDPPQVACLLRSYVTAYQCLHRVGDKRIERGDKVLVTGGSGCVGQAVIQLAKVAGAAEIYATTGGPAGSDVVEKLGATSVRRDPERWLPLLEGEMDIVIDSTCVDGYESTSRALSETGKLVVIDDFASGGGGVLSSLGVVAGGGAHMSMMKAKFLMDRTTTYDIFEEYNEWQDLYELDLQLLFQMLRDGSIKPPLIKTVPLSDVSNAQEEIENGGVYGAIVCVPDACEVTHMKKSEEGVKEAGSSRMRRQAREDGENYSGSLDEETREVAEKIWSERKGETTTQSAIRKAYSSIRLPSWDDAQKLVGNASSESVDSLVESNSYGKNTTVTRDISALENTGAEGSTTMTAGKMKKSVSFDGAFTGDKKTKYCQYSFFGDWMDFFDGGGGFDDDYTFYTDYQSDSDTDVFSEKTSKTGAFRQVFNGVKRPFDGMNLSSFCRVPSWTSPNELEDETNCDTISTNNYISTLQRDKKPSPYLSKLMGYPETAADDPDSKPISLNRSRSMSDDGSPTAKQSILKRTTSFTKTSFSNKPSHVDALPIATSIPAAPVKPDADRKTQIVCHKGFKGRGRTWGEVPSYTLSQPEKIRSRVASLTKKKLAQKKALDDLRREQERAAVARPSMPPRTTPEHDSRSDSQDDDSAYTPNDFSTINTGDYSLAFEPNYFDLSKTETEFQRSGTSSGSAGVRASFFKWRRARSRKT